MSAPTRRQLSTDCEVDEALAALDRDPEIVSATNWPGALCDLDQPGLYSWWVDPPGAAMLTEGLGHEIVQGRIYAGLTGATKWPSGTTGKQTLRMRVGSSHIRGRILGSTFRLTLASILRGQLGLVAVGPKLLAPISEKTLSGWIRDHLSVAVHDFPADPLSDLERQVLDRLNPPLNLDGMPATPVRLRLTELRRPLTRAPTTRLSTHIGNGLDGYYGVEGDGNALIWRGPTQRRDGEEEVDELQPSAAAWEEFWQTLDRLNVWGWDGRRYDTDGVLDGTHWGIEAESSGRVVRASGSNGYPGVRGLTPGKTFNAFCEALAKLAGGRQFA